MGAGDHIRRPGPSVGSVAGRTLLATESMEEHGKGLSRSGSSGMGIVGKTIVARDVRGWTQIEGRQ